MNDNKRRYLQEPFAQHLREIGISNACAVGLWGQDSPSIPAMQVSSEEVLDRFLATRQNLVPHRHLLAELFNGRKEFHVNRDAWQKVTAV